MHNLEPYYSWLHLYDPAKDEQSPFFGKEYNYDQYSDTIYGYYIDPSWDFMGSETLYVKVLFAQYEEGVVIIEMIGEWNDAVHNDIMNFKRNIVDHFTALGVNKFILIGENVLNFHGSDDCYYEEWFDDIEDGWIVAVNFHEHVIEEWQNFNVDSYVICGGKFQELNWRTLSPLVLCQHIDAMLQKRLAL